MDIQRDLDIHSSRRRNVIAGRAVEGSAGQRVYLVIEYNVNVSPIYKSVNSYGIARQRGLVRTPRPTNQDSDTIKRICWENRIGLGTNEVDSALQEFVVDPSYEVTDSGGSSCHVWFEHFGMGGKKPTIRHSTCFELNVKLPVGYGLIADEGVDCR